MKSPVRFTLLLLALSLTTCFMVKLSAELLAIASLHGTNLSLALFSFLTGSFILLGPLSFLALLRSNASQK